MNRDDDMTGAEGKRLSTLADALQGDWRMGGVVELKVRGWHDLDEPCSSHRKRPMRLPDVV